MSLISDKYVIVDLKLQRYTIIIMKEFYFLGSQCCDSERNSDINSNHYYFLRYTCDYTGSSSFEGSDPASESTPKFVFFKQLGCNLLSRIVL